MNKRIFAAISMFVIPDLSLAVLVIWAEKHVVIRIAPITVEYIIGCIIAYIIAKIGIAIFIYRRLYLKRVSYLRAIIAEFKKGHFVLSKNAFPGDATFTELFKDLSITGRHLDNLITTQCNEIEKFKELYHNIVISMSSYFLVFNDRDEVIFANESFCRKFQCTIDEISGKNINDVFYLVTGRIIDALHSARSKEESVVIERTHLLSKKKISIIADIKITSMVIQGEVQIVLVMDDVTSKCRKDYQISLITRISETIQQNDKIDRVLQSILTGVTSGSGLGFNRAMLFLYDEDDYSLFGAMAVGPDSLDEAIQIWGSVQDETGTQVLTRTTDESKRKGKNFYKKVSEKHYPVSSNNIFIEVLKTQKSIHINDAWKDDRVNEDVREFLGVKEFVMVPLVAATRAIGVIIADNLYNQAPILQENIELLTIFAAQAALSIESSTSLTRVKEEMEKIKSRQDAIVESEKLAAVGRIAAHIAHEIRNPLVTVGGYARRALSLSKNIPKGGGEGIQNATMIILKETERLEKILSNVMDFTRESPFIREYNNVNEIIEDTVDLLKNVFQEKHIKITLELQEDIPLVKSDFNQLKQVMLNLLQNAIDATPTGGMIDIESTVMAGHAAIFVRDTGDGFQNDDIPKAFEPFFTTKVTGVGLGLAIVKKIVNDHGGEISVSNKRTGGAEFKIELPIPE